MAEWRHVGTLRPPRIPGPQKPTSEVGVYLRSHQHDWSRLGSKTCPNGAVCPTFSCPCGAIICDLSVDMRKWGGDS